MAQVMGIKHIRDGVEAQAVLGADMSVMAVIGTAPLANAATFPLNRVVLVRTNDQPLRQALGSTGTIPDALSAISPQITDAAAKVVVVRVEDDEDVDAVIANILGSEANGTGMWALLDAPEELGETPRLIIVPGYTSQTESGVASIAVSNGGSGYTADFPVTATGGSGTGFAGIARVADGEVQSIEVINPGKDYATAPTLVLTDGDGIGAAATATIGDAANQICQVLPTIAERLKAQFLPEGPTASRALALAWMETLPRSAVIIHPLRQDAKVSVNGSVVTKPLSPFIIAQYARRDAEVDGIPSRSIANQSINGLVGVTPKIRLDITSDASEGMADIEARFGIVVRGESGVDGSLSDGGYVFWGTDTLSADSQWQFANVVRLRSYVEINQIKAIRFYLGRYNLTVQTVQAVANTMETMLSGLRAEGHIIDYRVLFEPDNNSPEDLRLGFLDITFKMEEPAPLRKVTIRSRRYPEALDTMVSNIAIQLGTLTAA